MRSKSSSITKLTAAALVEGSTLAGKLGQSGQAYSDIAPSVLCQLQKYWVSSDKFIKANSMSLNHCFCMK